MEITIEIEIKKRQITELIKEPSEKLNIELDKIFDNKKKRNRIEKIILRKFNLIKEKTKYKKIEITYEILEGEEEVLN